MRNKLFILVFMFLFFENSFGFETKLLRSDKELESNFVNTRLVAKAHEKLGNSFGMISDFNLKYMQVLGESIDRVTTSKGKCDLNLISQMRFALHQRGIPSQRDDFEAWIHLARKENLIDDIFATYLAKLNRIENKMKYFSQNPIRPSRRNKIRYKVQDKEKIIELYRKLGIHWPNEDDYCGMDFWGQLASLVTKAYNIKPGRQKQLHFILSTTNLYAYKNGLISLENWNRLEVLRQEKVLNQNMTLSSYLDNILNAKNKLSDELNYIRRHDPSVVTSQKAKRFLRKYVDRAKGLTLRSKLYEKFNSHQILILSEILIKTSKRMNADRSEIHIDYQEDVGVGPDEIYVISPMEQYRMSLKMLRKDVANISLSGLFAGNLIEYEDIVMAALETGVIGFDELDYIIQYENFWKPSRMREPVWKQVFGFFVNVAGSASFYLPAPFNFIGSIGLIFTETFLFKKKQNIDSQGNANSIF